MKRVYTRTLALLMVLSLVLLAVGCGSSGDNKAASSKPADSKAAAPADSKAAAPADKPADKPAANDKEKASGSSAKIDSITIGTASAGSSSNAQGIAFAKFISDDLGISTKATAIGGSDAVVKNLGDNRVQLGVATAVALHAGYNGIAPQKEKIDIRILVAAQRAEPRQLIVRADSGIKTPADLHGKKIIGKRGAIKDIELFMEGIVKAYNLDKSKITIVETADTNEATRALKQGTVDAGILPGDLRSGPITEMTEHTAMKFISFPEDKLKIINGNMGPAIDKAIIPKGTYKGQDEDIFTPGLTQTLTSRADLPDDVAYNIVKSILNNQERLEKNVLGGKDWVIKEKFEPNVAGVPFHPGVLKYYKEKGLVK